MENQSYYTSIEVEATPAEVFNRLTELSQWWSKDFEGSSNKVGDEFVINHPGRHYSKQRLIEAIPGQKIVWLVTKSELNWLEQDKTEWTGTTMIFELISKGTTTELKFIHEGLIPEKECYTKCTKGWDMVIKNWLFNYIKAS
ncbi:SRPBCC family protein [Mucilaginibacter lappiensis]|uniref:SRPBCC family protein n=1 Tax=Mucilaginibacter lappiensis TaxID=354630 RepID=UPI003D1AC9A9